MEWNPSLDVAFTFDSKGVRVEECIPKSRRRVHEESK